MGADHLPELKDQTCPMVNAFPLLISNIQPDQSNLSVPNLVNGAYDSDRFQRIPREDDYFFKLPV